MAARPADRVSSIADKLDPRAQSSARAISAASAAAPRSKDAPPPVATPTAGSAAWWDPVNALGYYFDFLQGLFDANRAVTMAVATAITAPLRRSRG